MKSPLGIPTYTERAKDSMTSQVIELVTENPYNTESPLLQGGIQEDLSHGSIGDYGELL